jgi:hypothetical protein
MHDGNVMFDRKNKEFIVTDPSSNQYKASLSAKRPEDSDYCEEEFAEPEFQLVG